MGGNLSQGQAQRAAAVFAEVGERRTQIGEGKEGRIGEMPLFTWKKG